MKLRFPVRGLFFALIPMVATIVIAQPVGKSVDSAMSGIEKLRQQDIAATISSNVDQLVALWANDGVLIGQGAKPLVGKTAIRSALTENFAKNPAWKVLKYAPEINSLQIDGNIAYEWGSFTAIHQESLASQPIRFHARFLRVMKLQSDGSWKFVRVMWNTEGQ